MGTPGHSGDDKSIVGEHQTNGNTLPLGGLIYEAAGEPNLMGTPARAKAAEE